MLEALWRCAHLEPCRDIQSPCLPWTNHRIILPTWKKERAGPELSEWNAKWKRTKRMITFVCRDVVFFELLISFAFSTYLRMTVCLLFVYIYTLRLPCPQYARGFAYVMCWLCDMRIPCFLCPCPPLYTLGIWRLVLCSLSPLTVGSLDFWGFVSLLTFGWARVYKFH